MGQRAHVLSHIGSQGHDLLDPITTHKPALTSDTNHKSRLTPVLPDLLATD